MANKFKAGDWAKVLDTKNVREHNKNAVGYEFEITEKEIYPREKPVVYLDVANKYFLNYTESDLKLIKKPKKMETKKKTGGITPKQGMYFTANMGKKKIRGFIGEVFDTSWGNETNVTLEGKDFSEDGEKDFPTQDTLLYSPSEKTFEEALKSDLKITNFVVCTDKRQKAVIDGGKSPMFGDWKVVKNGDMLIFGCGSVEVGVKDAKLFAEIFCDYGEPSTIHEYHLTNIGDNTELEDYYQVRKYLEDNYTVAQKKVFDNVLEQIENSGEQRIDELECSEMKALLAKF